VDVELLHSLLRSELKDKDELRPVNALGFVLVLFSLRQGPS
jgi:hypothetical protein